MFVALFFWQRQTGLESQIHVSFSSTEMHSTVSRVCVLHLISLLAQGVNLWNAKYRVCLTCNLFVFLVMCNLLKSENPEISVKVNTVVDWFNSMQCVIFLHKYKFYINLSSGCFFFYLYRLCLWNLSLGFFLFCLSWETYHLELVLAWRKHARALLETQWTVLENKHKMNISSNLSSYISVCGIRAKRLIMKLIVE